MIFAKATIIERSGERTQLDCNTITTTYNHTLVAMLITVRFLRVTRFVLQRADRFKEELHKILPVGPWVFSIYDAYSFRTMID